ncbi:MAG: hypothetical protein JKX80_02260 [Candidatus Pacebacteria bacterium]|nr:hypothetical protein [Candidatus Paceibacterota bacterium]
MRFISLLGLLILLFVHPSTARADFFAPPVFGGGGIVITPPSIPTPTSTANVPSPRSGGVHINVGAAVGAAAACAIATAVFDTSVVNVRTFIKYGVIPCTLSTGAVILVALAGGPAVVGVIVGVIVYGVVRWIIRLFENRQNLMQLSSSLQAKTTYNFTPDPDCWESQEFNGFCYGR